MSSESLDGPEIAGGWQPAAALRGPLFWGLVGAVAAGGLALASTAAQLLEVPGVETWTGVLSVVAVVFQIPVLVALVRVGQDSTDGDPTWDPLARSAGAALGLMWLLAVVSFATDFVGEREWAVFVLFLVAGVILVGLIALGTPEGAGPIAAVAFFGVRFGLGFLLIGRRLPGDVSLFLAVVLLMVVCGIVFPIWFATALWGRRHKLGGAAAVLAVAVALGLVGFLAVVGWIVHTAATTPNLMARTDEFEALFRPHIRAGLVVSLLADGLAALAAALLFRGIAARLPDPRAQDAGPVPPSDLDGGTGPEREF